MHEPPRDAQSRMQHPTQQRRGANDNEEERNEFNDSKPSEGTNERQISGIEVFEGFRPPYADDNVRTGFSGIVVKKKPETNEPARHYSLKRLEEDTIEPTESEVGLSADLDEGTVFSQRGRASKDEQPKIYEAPVIKKEYPRKDLMVKVPQRNNYPSNHQEYSPKIDVLTAEEAQQQEQWMQFQKQIDQEYERKLKEVGEEATKKIQMYEKQHRNLFEKT